LISFGAAVSIAEILTGTYFAPLGFCKLDDSEKLDRCRGVCVLKYEIEGYSVC